MAQNSDFYNRRQRHDYMRSLSGESDWRIHDYRLWSDLHVKSKQLGAVVA